MRVLPSSISPTNALQNSVKRLSRKENPFLKREVCPRLVNFALGAPAGLLSSGYHTLALFKITLLPCQLIVRYGFNSTKLDSFGASEFCKHALKVILCAFSSIFTPTFGLVFVLTNYKIHCFFGLAGFPEIKKPHHENKQTVLEEVPQPAPIPTLPPSISGEEVPEVGNQKGGAVKEPTKVPPKPKKIVDIMSPENLLQSKVLQNKQLVDILNRKIDTAGPDRPDEEWE